MNNICDSCGFGLWRYNHDTLTCKHGHLWMVDGEKVGEHTLAPAAPQPAFVPGRSKRETPPWAWVLLGAAGDFVLHLLAGLS